MLSLPVLRLTRLLFETRFEETDTGQDQKPAMIQILRMVMAAAALEQLNRDTFVSEVLYHRETLAHYEQLDLILTAQKQADLLNEEVWLKEARKLAMMATCLTAMAAAALELLKIE